MAASAPTSLDVGLASPPPIATFPTGSKVALPRWLVLLVLIAAQGLLARFMSELPLIGTLQGAIIIAGFVYAGLKRNVPLTLCLLAYLPGAEITWRQSKAVLPYLTAPYVAVFASLLAIGTVYNHFTKSGRLVLLYLGLLLPSSIITRSVRRPAKRTSACSTRARISASSPSRSRSSGVSVRRSS